MRILLLVHRDFVPPGSIEGLSDKEIAPWKGEFDVRSTLEELGHEVLVVGAHAELAPIREAIQSFKPKVIFNMLEEFDNEAIFDQHVVSYLELLGQKYTGCNPRGMMLARDKALTKKILSYHRIKVPHFMVVPRKSPRCSFKNLRYPLIVKSQTEEASLAISKKSIVTNEQALRERIDYLHTQHNTDVIAEEYVEGREVYVGLLGNRRLQTFTPWELIIENLGKGEPNIATRRLKFNMKYQEKKGVRTEPASNLTDAQMKALENLSKRVFRALLMSGYGRMDYRISNAGEIYLIEANPNPNIEYGEDFAESASHFGLRYPQLLTKIVEVALRHTPNDYG